MDVIRSLAQELVEVKKEAAQGQLLPLPGQTVESCSLELGATSKTVGSSMAQLLTAANQGNENYTGIAARDTANALQVLTGSVRGVAAFTKNPQTQEYIIMTAQQVMDQSVGLISEVKYTLENPSAPNKQQRLAQAAKKVSQALNHMVNCLPGVIEYENAIRAIAQASLSLQQDKVSLLLNFLIIIPFFSFRHLVVSLIKLFNQISVLLLQHLMSLAQKLSHLLVVHLINKLLLQGTLQHNFKNF